MSESAFLQKTAPEVCSPAVHLLQREPFRLFFPLGLLLSWLGVGHWLLHALGILADFKPVFHAMTQVQGFLICFAIGFLFTMIPRRTQTEAPSKLQIAIAALGPVATTLCAWLSQWAVAQVFWLATGGTLVGFLVSRVRRTKANRQPPNSFVWLPIAFMMGMVGAVLAGVGAMGGAWWLHHLGQTFVLQGMFVGMVLGVGGLAIPLMTRGERPPDGSTSSKDLRARWAHLFAALVLIGSFFVEALVSPRLGHFLRGTVALLVLLQSAKIHRAPTKPGWTRWLIWLSVWMVPLGFFAASALELHPKAGLHLTFIGGLAMLTLAVSAQVTLGHGGFDALLGGRPWAIAVIAVGCLLALVARVTMDLDPDRYLMWMGIAAASFLAATSAWMVFLLPKLWRPPTEAA